VKQFLHKTFSICMALLLLASTVSWTVGRHYCMGRLMNVSLFEHAADCGMTETSFSTEKKSCCNDEMIVIDVQDDLKISLENILLDKQQFLVAYTLSYINLLKVGSEQEVLYNYYPPPLLVKNIQLLDEVFLI